MKTPQERKAASEQFLRSKGIGVFEGLPMPPSEDEVQLKPQSAVCRRAAAALICAQIAYCIRENAREHLSYFVGLLERYGVADALNGKERSLFTPKVSPQTALDVAWEYECYWSLVWALGLVPDMREANDVCNVEAAIHFVADCPSMEFFEARCRMRSKEEILDMLDLYYRYHWACVQNRWVDHELPIGDLNEEVVYERRRGLQWLISPEEDWHEISLDT